VILRLIARDSELKGLASVQLSVHPCCL